VAYHPPFREEGGYPDEAWAMGEGNPESGTPSPSRRGGRGKG